MGGGALKGPGGAHKEIKLALPPGPTAWDSLGPREGAGPDLFLLVTMREQPRKANSGSADPPFKGEPYTRPLTTQDLRLNTDLETE